MGKLRCRVYDFVWSFWVLCRLEVASYGLQTFFIVIFALFYWRNIVIGEIIALFLPIIWLISYHYGLFLRFLCLLVFVEGFVVHFDEIQGLVWHLQSLFVFLNVAGNFGFFANSRFSLVLILLKNFLFAFGRIVVNRWAHSQLFLIECHYIVVIWYILFQKGIFLWLVSIERRSRCWCVPALNANSRRIFEYPSLAGVSCILCHFNCSRNCVFLWLYPFEFS